MILDKEILSRDEAIRILAEIADAESDTSPVEPHVELDELAEFIGYARARRSLRQK